MSFETVWAPYAPDAAMPWTLRRVVHLHRRAGFAATWDELQRDLAAGPEVAAARLVGGKSVETSPAEFASTAELLADAAVAAGEIDRLKACWFYRMLFGPDPLGERLTLLWHDHFATADSKVRNPALMRRQNDTLRTHARGRFAVLLDAAVREPALLLYLDAPANRKGHPNENLGRELLELFTLGVGHYGEADVKEAARALTGWSVEGGQFVESAAKHDDGSKTILGQTGAWTGGDLVTLLTKHPATAMRVAVKLCRLFFGENGPPPDALRALAEGLRERDLDIGWACGVVLRSRLFFADANLGTRVLGPVEYVVGTARALGLFDPAPSTLALADWSARMGQDVFEPPNVGGWPPGRAWLHARSLIARTNYAAALLSGPNAGRPREYDAVAAAKAAGFTDAATFHHRLLFGTDPPNGRMTVAQMIASPEGQLA